MSQIHWLTQVDGLFTVPGDWSTGTVPSTGDDAILDASGPTKYTVTSKAAAQTVASIQTASTATLFVSAGKFTATNGSGAGANAGAIKIGDGVTFKLSGTLANNGAVNINGATKTTYLIIATGGATLTGGGTLALTASARNQVFGATAATTLTNVDNTISGGGLLGDGKLTLINQAKGVINANTTQVLVVDTVGETLVNGGLIESTGAGGLYLRSTTVDQSSGGVLSVTAGQIQLQGAHIIGGFLKSTASTAIHTGSGANILDGGSGSIANQGRLIINNSTSLTLQNSILNTGQLILTGSSGSTTLSIAATGATLMGGGLVTLSNSGFNRIAGAVSTAILTNVDNTISGGGQLGGAILTLVNGAKGVINATTATALTLNTKGAAVTNSGLIEATGAGGLSIVSTTVNDASGGTLFAGTGSKISLTSATIAGGIINTKTTGQVVTVDKTSVLDGVASTLTNQGTVNIADNTALTIQGAIANSGKINLASGGSGTFLIVGAAGVTLSGGGTIGLSNNSANQIKSSLSTTLFNVDNTIAGAGLVGNNHLALNNEAKGVVNASLSTALILNTPGINITNSGLLESTGTGGLTLSGVTVVGTGTILAANNAVVSLAGAVIQGQTLASVGTGAVSTADSASVLDGQATHQVTVVGNMLISDNTSLKIRGQINLGQTVLGVTTNGTLTVGSTGNVTSLVVDTTNASLKGGNVVLADSTNSQIIGVLTGSKVSTLTNAGTILGAGAIGANLSLINTGTIEAVGTNALTLPAGNPAAKGSNVINSSGLLEAVNPGALLVTGGLALSGVTVSGGGTIAAAGAATHVDLTTTTISGETLATSGGGAINVLGSGVLLDGVAGVVTTTGTVTVGANTSLKIQGTLAGAGSIALISGAGGQARLGVTTKGVTLTGGGSIALNDSTSNYVYAYGGAATLTNASDTIAGAGTVGNANLTLINQAAGVIDANGASTLSVYTGAHTITNAGLIEGTGTGGLALRGPISNSGTLLAKGGLLSLSSDTVTNSGAGVLTAQAGGEVDLQNATVLGGVISTAAGGVISANSGATTLKAATITNAGTLRVVGYAQLLVQGAINNTGTVQVGGVGTPYGRLQIATAGVTLIGAGQVVLSDNPSNYIYASGGAATLTNTNNTISGAGSIGNANTTLINQAAGVVDATGANALTIYTGTHTITNAGLLEGTGAGGLLVRSAVANSGTVLAKGGRVTLSNETLTNTSLGVVNAAAGGEIDLHTAIVVGGTVSIAAGGAVLANSGLSSIKAATLTNQGTLGVVDYAQLQVQGLINNTGLIEVGLGTPYARLQIGTAGVTLTGAGQVTLSDNGANYFYGYGAPATLTNVNNTISGAGLIGSTNVTLINQASGTINATGANKLFLNTTDNTITNAGLLENTGAGGLALESAVINSGTILAAGAGGVYIRRTLTNTGQINENAGSSITLVGATIDDTKGGSIGPVSKLNLSSSYIVGGTLTVAAGGVVTGNSGTSAIETTSLVNQGTIVFHYGLQIQGPVNNSGLIQVGLAPSYGRLVIDGSGVTLSGGGAVTLTDSSSNSIYSTGGTLTNIDNIISGAGRIGGGDLTVINQAAGTINGTGANALYLYTGFNTITNAGLIEGTGRAARYYGGGSPTQARFWRPAKAALPRGRPRSTGPRAA